MEALCYKLRMFVVLIDGTTNVYFDNTNVVINSNKPESTLKKEAQCDSLSQGTRINSPRYN
jgi:hypothetical protein